MTRPEVDGPAIRFCPPTIVKIRPAATNSLSEALAVRSEAYFRSRPRAGCCVLTSNSGRRGMLVRVSRRLGRDAPWSFWGYSVR